MRQKEKKALPRKHRQKQYHRKQILNTALDLFSKYGYHKISMHKIAKEAEFSVGTLYNFFSDKEDLYRALIMDLTLEFLDCIKKAGPRAVPQILQKSHSNCRLLLNASPVSICWYRHPA